jgi:hypothetical protein
MKTKTLSTLLLGSAVALVACAFTSCNSQPVPEVSQIKKVVNDFEKTPDAIPFWPGKNKGPDCSVRNGNGYKQSRGIHMIYPGAQIVSPESNVFFNAPELVTSDADGIMFWIYTPKPLGVSLSADSKEVSGRYDIGDGVLVMDEKGQMLDSKKCVKKAINGQRTIGLDAGFKGWIIVPNTLSKDGTNSGWMHGNASKDKVSQLSSLLIWTSGGEFDIDMLGLYQEKP